jgi:hypothetical protein
VNYDDAILAPGSWPGTTLRYAMHAEGLVLTLSCDPDAGGDETYRDAAAQLADPALAIALTTTVSGGIVDDGTLLRPFLEEYLASREGASVTLPLTVAERNGHAFPVAVALTLSRPDGLVHRTGAHASVPGSDTVTTAVAPDLDDPDAFAALAGWHVAVRGPACWALRWTATASGGAPVLAAIPPLSTELVGGEAQVVTAYDEEWRATTGPRTYSGIDLGDWATTYLAALDDLGERFAPVRADVAKALAASVVPLSEGDVTEARDVVERIAPLSLAAAYAAPAIAQVPMQVTGPAGTRLTAAAGELALSGHPACLTSLVTANGPLGITPTGVVRDTPLGPRSMRLLSGDAVDAGSVDARLPARPVPAAPVLAEQSATQAPGGTFAWDHTVTVTLPRASGQDELRLLVTYGDPAPPLAEAPASGGPLFAALASFMAAWPLLSPATGTPSDAWLDAVEARVRPVAGAWATAAPHAAPPDTGDYVVSLRDLGDGVVRLRARDADHLPTVNGASPGDAPQGNDGWHTADYAVPGLDGTVALTFVWRLDAHTHPSATVSAYVVRNAGLPEAFVMRTPRVAFPQPVVPLLVVAAGPPVAAGPTLAATLATALADVTEWAAGRTLRLGLAYSYALDGEQRTSVPVLAIGEQPISDDLVARLAAEVDRWFRTEDPPTADALLEATAVVYDDVNGEHVPLVTFEPIAATVPARLVGRLAP